MIDVMKAMFCLEHRDGAYICEGGFCKQYETAELVSVFLFQTLSCQAL